MVDLWLVRHGQTEWNVAGRWQGQAPEAPGLNDTGWTQALAVQDQLKGFHFSAIYSSDLLRARQTAELIAKPFGLKVILEPRLREMNLGAWEGLLFNEIEGQYPLALEERARDPFHTRAPQGEAPLEVAERVMATLNEIVLKHRGESVLIVSHGVSLAVILCHGQGIPLNQVYDHIPEHAKPYHVSWK